MLAYFRCCGYCFERGKSYLKSLCSQVRDQREFLKSARCVPMLVIMTSLIIRTVASRKRGDSFSHLPWLYPPFMAIISVIYSLELIAVLQMISLADKCAFRESMR